jgi:NDP-sugar pyrophosphorylase family protein
MKAMILAAGEGTRLRPLTLTVPKPVVPIANQPLLGRTLSMLAGQGVLDIAVNLFHRPEAIREMLRLPDWEAMNLSIRFSHEEQLSGTAGGVKRLESHFAGEDAPFLVLYGDNLYDVDLDPLIAFHVANRASGALATIATFEAPNPSACGLVVTDDQGRVTRFQEKPPPSEVFTREANAGVYVLEPEALRYIPSGGAPDFGRDIFPTLLRERPGSLYATRLAGYLQDTGTVPAYRQANWDLLEGRLMAYPPLPDRARQDLLVGNDCDIASTVSYIGRNVIGDRCAIGAGVHLEECILWEGCRIDAGVRVTGAVLGRGVAIGAGAMVEAGAVLGDHTAVAPGARVMAGELGN